MKDKLVSHLSSILPRDLAAHLVDDFVKIRRDVAAGTLERAAPGKFVESTVQTLQYLDKGAFEDKPNIDEYLRTLESRATSLHDGLKICAARIGRAMYTLRNKRSILHKGEVDPNSYDLHFLHAGAQWILAELIRSATGKSMEESGRLVQQVQAPVGGLVEDFGSRRLVLADTSVREELLILLHSVYPDALSVEEILSSTDRRSAKSVTNRLRELWTGKRVEREGTAHRLTQRGLQEAADVIARNL